MPDARRSIAWIAAMFVSACGASSEPPSLDFHEPETNEDRSSSYSVTAPGAPSPCGWIVMPNGGSEYVACPSSVMRSPISDPPADEEDGLGMVPGRFDPRPEPPGDPPPM